MEVVEISVILMVTNPLKPTQTKTREKVMGVKGETQERPQGPGKSCAPARTNALRDLILCHKTVWRREINNIQKIPDKNFLWSFNNQQEDTACCSLQSEDINIVLRSNCIDSVRKGPQYASQTSSLCQFFMNPKALVACGPISSRQASIQVPSKMKTRNL